MMMFRPYQCLRYENCLDNLKNPMTQKVNKRHQGQEDGGNGSGRSCSASFKVDGPIICQDFAKKEMRGTNCR